MTTKGRNRLRSVIVALALACFTTIADGDTISFSLSKQSVTTTRGADVTFDGTITNLSGSDLNASDFFFNFSGFDPSALTPSQDLGVLSNFLIPNGTTSSDVIFFDVQMASFLQGSSFALDVQLEDINGDLSASQAISIATPTGVPTPTPEPSSIILAGAGLIEIAVGRFFAGPPNRKRRAHSASQA